jgi:hypothetical protein
MSFKSSPWWNGSQESFFGRFKVEFGDFDRFESLPDLVEAIYQHLQYFSESRIKSKLKMSPAVFAKKWLENQKLHVIHSQPKVISLPPGPPSCRFAADPYY